MAQYISKSALVAEIERHLEYANNGIEYAQMGIDSGIEHCKVELLAWQHCQNMCKQILSFIDTLEVKEVDIEKKKMEWVEQLCKYFKANYLYVSGHESFISDFRMYAKNLK